MNIDLINDTSSSNHAGCRSVVRSPKKAISELAGANIIAWVNLSSMSDEPLLFDLADILFVNGKGTIHHSGRQAKFLLNSIFRAKLSSKSIVLTNGLFQQCECPAPDLIKYLTLLTVMGPRSAAFAKRFGGNPRTLLYSAADPQFLGLGKALPLHNDCVIG